MVAQTLYDEPMLTAHLRWPLILSHNPSSGEFHTPALLRFSAGLGIHSDPHLYLWPRVSHSQSQEHPPPSLHWLTSCLPVRSQPSWPPNKHTPKLGDSFLEGSPILRWPVSSVLNRKISETRTPIPNSQAGDVAHGLPGWESVPAKPWPPSSEFDFLCVLVAG